MASFIDKMHIPKLSGLELLQWAHLQAEQKSKFKTGKKKRCKYSGMISTIAPGVYLSNKTAASDFELLKSLSIVAIINIGGGSCHFPANFEYFRISVPDSDEASISPFFERVCEFAHVWSEKGAILFHCRGGMHRSPTILAAYLMKHRELSLLQTMEVISLGRPIARPSPHMVLELEEFEQNLNKISTSDNHDTHL